MRPTIALMVVGLAAGFTAEARAQESLPPPVAFASSNAPSTLTQKPVTLLRLGSLSVVLEKTPLAEVQATIGLGHISEQGDAAGAVHWLCYTSDSPAQRIWIESGDEMGGPEHLVLSVVARSVNAGSPKTENCPRLPAQWRPVRLDHDIWLGMTRAELEKRLGPPSQIKGNILSYDYGRPVDRGDVVWGDRPVDPDLTVLNTLDVRVAGGKVVALEAYRVTSY